MAHTEMSQCLREMNKLQERMSQLERKKQQLEIQKKTTQTTVDPNLAILERWLAKSYDNVAFQRNVQNYRVRRRDPETPIEDIYEKWICEARRAPTKHYDVAIFDHMKGRPNSGGGRNEGQSQQEFMLNFVGATRNMFKILTKRVDDLSDLLEK